MGGPQRIGPILQASNAKTLSKFRSKSKLSGSTALDADDAKFLTLSTREVMSEKLTLSPPDKIFHSFTSEHFGFSSQDKNERRSVIRPMTSPAMLVA